MLRYLISPPHKSVPKRLAAQGPHSVRLAELENFAEDKFAAFCARTITLLRPVVRVPTDRSNRQLKEVCGFALAKLDKTGVERKEARSVGCVIDCRRNLNKQDRHSKLRLKVRKAKLTVFPAKLAIPRRGDDLKAPTTRTDLTSPPSFSAEAPHKMNKEGRRFDAAWTPRDF
ncbi:hypothetical protein BDM02DRAFT_3187412 [Thelephora ganbajun]|uniref:Uncharacterized protein n=1 Tax=Thelephora ganbajun TaxID=370292 RepID=A0ACB6ZEQ8_THEGA|nr:hypothetical protein BDM02DRAFT_3187412 [Thelephora ganbajun]